MNDRKIIAIFILTLAVNIACFASEQFIDPGCFTIVSSIGNKHIVSYNGKYGVVDEYGDIDILPAWDSITPALCSSSWAAFHDYEDPSANRMENIYIVRKDGLCGCVFSDGTDRCLIDIKYTHIYPSINGYTLCKREGAYDLYLLHDVNDLLCCELIFISTDDYLYIDQNNEVIIGRNRSNPDVLYSLNGEVLCAECDTIYDFVGNYAIVKDDDLFGLLYRSGSYVLECTYENIQFVSESCVIVDDGNRGMLYIIDDNRFIYGVDADQKAIEGYEYETVVQQNLPLRIYDDCGNAVYLDDKGNNVFGRSYEDGSIFYGYWAIVKDSGSYYVINQQGETIALIGMANNFMKCDRGVPFTSISGSQRFVGYYDVNENYCLYDLKEQHIINIENQYIYYYETYDHNLIGVTFDYQYFCIQTA